MKIIQITPDKNLCANIRLILMKTTNGQIHTFNHKGTDYSAKKVGNLFQIESQKETISLKRGKMIQFFLKKEIQEAKEEQNIEPTEEVFIQVNG